MKRRTSRRTTLTGLVCVLGACLGCEGPTAPGWPFQVQPLALTAVAPATGSSGGGRRARLVGTGFHGPMTATVDGVPVIDLVIVSSMLIDVVMPPHAPGQVDIVLMSASRDGARATIAYTYVYVAPPAVTNLFPTRVSTEGTEVYITGTAFVVGTRVTIDGVTVPAMLFEDKLYTTAPPHPEGAVDVVVINPDGQMLRMPGALTYVRPESFDFNGNWDGIVDDGSHDGTPIRFTIQNNVMVSLSCGTGADLLPNPAPTVALGRISSSDGRMTGLITSEGSAFGRITIPPCGAHLWGANKR